MTASDKEEKAFDALTIEYAEQIKPLLELATKAYGSRDTVSPQHTASREYTRLLCEFHKQGGSLLQLAAAIGKSYAGLNRRIKTAAIEPSSKRPRKKFTDEQMAAAINTVRFAKEVSTEEYHDTLLYFYEQGYSLAKFAKALGDSSAYPLYYGKNQAMLRRDGQK